MSRRNEHKRHLDFDLGGLKVQDIYCLNLRNRKDRKKRMERQARRRRFPVKFWRVDKNKRDPVRGCLESHVSIIRDARKRKLQAILILEDDAKLLYRRLYVPTPPEEWDMLYLGGNVQKVFDDEKVNTSKYWKRAQMLTTHAYIVHSRLYNKLIEELPKYDGPIDVFYCEQIHPNYQCFIVTPTIFTQFDGYSDVEERNINYDGILSKDVNDIHENDEMTPDKLDETETKWSKDEEGFMQCRLVLPNVADKDLPHVSIVTPTYCRSSIFPLAVRNFYKFQYPPEKLEWVVIDDSPKGQTVSEWIPRDTRIKYVRCEVPEGQRLSIGQKRNIGVTNASYEYIVHMDDDDYYYPHSILARVKVLLANPEKQCVFSTMVGTYDLVTNASAFSFDVDPNGNRTRPCEATMAYTREFWLERKYNESFRTSEGFHFIRGRWDKCVTMPYSFIMIAFTHNTNLTRDLRRVIPAEEKTDDDDGKKPINFIDTFDRETQEFIKTIVETLDF